MIYPETFEVKLGFDQIRAKLKNYCLSTAGQEWVDNIKFSTDLEFMKTLLKQNLEFRLILEKGKHFLRVIFLILRNGFKKYPWKVIGWKLRNF